MVDYAPPVPSDLDPAIYGLLPARDNWHVVKRQNAPPFWSLCGITVMGSHAEVRAAPPTSVPLCKGCRWMLRHAQTDGALATKVRVALPADCGVLVHENEHGPRAHLVSLNSAPRCLTRCGRLYWVLTPITRTFPEGISVCFTCVRYGRRT